MYWDLSKRKDELRNKSIVKWELIMKILVIKFKGSSFIH